MIILYTQRIELLLLFTKKNVKYLHFNFWVRRECLCQLHICMYRTCD